MGELTLQYEPWIKKVARIFWSRYRGRYEFDELMAIAYLACLEAEERYDPEASKFPTFMYPRIEGAITDALSNTNTSQQKLAKRVYKFIEEHVKLHNLVPPEHVILEELQLTKEQFEDLIGAITEIKIVSHDDLNENDLISTVDLDTMAEFGRVEDAMKTLSSSEHLLITEFMNGDIDSSAEIKRILGKLRTELNIKDVN